MKVIYICNNHNSKKGEIRDVLGVELSSLLSMGFVVEYKDDSEDDSEGESEGEE